MRRTRAFLLTLGLLLPSAGVADTLADVRAELGAMYQQIESLKAELSPTGSSSNLNQDGTLLDRIISIESELSRLTAKTEQLEFRIGRVVQDGTNRIGDLEFRICELDENCDIGTLGETPTLGGETIGATSGQQVSQPSGGPQLAISEAADFDQAKALFEQGDFAMAIQKFDAFNDTYPGGPLAAQANLLKGEAHEAMGDTAPAARAYLNAFSSDPNGQDAPRALTRLGTSLGRLGQQREACVTLGEVEIRFPNNAQVTEARTSMRDLGCQ
ncbi:tol-pal system protein YbgF [Parasulfitobacter algicola]|uniref:Cell division coordinator CpoB n=1 Tax=Parasulfitobacter algicola TaxID=2614809 RepID=A0ABX2IMW2_9RHOB|nr:tol-pal system protein YbgF [Sulfitobacter algicola]NSX54214.1 tol-pal system protein YbgF [Sulfitobacter algicola]